MVAMNQQGPANSTIICPTCMVHLPSISKLSEHWKRFHSRDAILSRRNNVSESSCDDVVASTETLDWRIFHEFAESTITRSACCDYCQEMMYSDAKQCQACDFTCHSDCEQMVVTLCDRPSTCPSTVGESTKGSSVHIPRYVPSQAVTSENDSQHQNDVSPVGHHHQCSNNNNSHGSKRDLLNEKKNGELDLAYVTDRLVVMSFPANGLESAYKQQLSGVTDSLKEKHNDNYMIFNVSERRYDLSKINNQVLDFGWPDHLAPPLERLLSIVKSIDSWTSAKQDNIAVIHCKGGRGRVGVVIAAYIQFSKLCPSPQAALDWFALKGYLDHTFAVDLHPSQLRYVFYVGEMLEGRLKISHKPIALRDLILHGIPDIEADGGCHPFFRVYQGLKLIATSDTYIASADMERVCVRFDKGINLDGDVMIKCGQKGKRESSSDVIFRCQFHTNAVKDYGLVFDKPDLDEACNDDRFPSTCQIEFIFGPLANEADAQPDTPAQDTTRRPYELLLRDPNNCVADLIDGKSFAGGFRSMDSNIARSHDSDMFNGPHHVPGPLNGNMYAQIDPLMKATLRHKSQGHPGTKGAPYDMDKGIQALDELLGDLGHFTQTHFQAPSPDAHVSHDVNHNVVDAKQAAATRPCDDDSPVARPSLPARQNSSYTAVMRLRSLQRQSPQGNHLDSNHAAAPCGQASPVFDYTDSYGNNSMVQHQGCVSGVSPAADDVFAFDDRVNEAGGRGRSATKYDNVTAPPHEHHSSVAADAHQFNPGLVASQVRHFTDEVTPSTENARRGICGVPLPGLVKGVDCQDKISTFNQRSLATGQCAPQKEHLYMRGNGPKRIVQQHVSSGDSQSFDEAPEYTTPFPKHSSDSETGHTSSKSTQVLVMNGHVPSGLGLDSKRHNHHINNNNNISHGLLTTADFDYTCDKDDRGSPRLDTISGSDSAYGESMKSSSSPLSSPFGEQPPRLDAGDKPANGFGSQSSSSTSIEDGYARIEDIKPRQRQQPQQQQHTNEKRCIDEEVITVSAVKTDTESAMMFDFMDMDPPNTIKRSPFLTSPTKTPSPRLTSKSVHSGNISPVRGRMASPKLTSRGSASPKTRLGSSPHGSSPLSSPRLAERLHHAREASLAASPRLLPHANHPSDAFLTSRFDKQYSRSQSNCSVSSDGSADAVPHVCPGCQWVEQSSCHSSHSSSLNDPASMPEHTLPRKGRRRSQKSTSSASSPLHGTECFREVLRYPNIKFDSDTLDFWYKPRISREEATALLRGKQPGAFVVRDSQSYEGAFGLAVKVSTPPLGIIQQVGGDLSKIDLSSELIRHFLIEPCRQGVRLKGNNNEPVFPSLVALIYQHSLTKLALPILLVVPNEDLVVTDSIDGESECDMTVEQILFEKGAACNLVYLGLVDVEGLTGDGAVQYSVGKLLMTNKTAALTIINIKVNAQGITMTDNERKLFFRKHYNMDSVLHAGIDPKDRRIGLKELLPESSYQAACFGIVWRKPGKQMEHECHVFAELDHDQPASAVISFIQKAMRYPKNQ